MFGRILYFDKKTIGEYSAIISGQRHLEIDEYKISNGKGVAADFKLVSADLSANKEYTARVTENILYDCFEFEKKLVGRDDFYDFTQSSDYDITTVPRGCIVKVDSFAYVPEGFDMMQLIDRFKPLVMDTVETDAMDNSSKVALRTFLGSAKATKIPLVLEAEESLLVAKINQENLLCEYEEIEEWEEEQITILARVSSGTIKPSKAYYDPLKDFMSLNRMMRKSIGDRGDVLKQLFLDQEYRSIDILAVYR